MVRGAFVTGGSGFIGSHLIDALLKSGWQVRALAHKSRILQEANVEVQRGDICDQGALREGLKGVDVLFHLASALGSSTIGRSEFFRVNASGTEAVLTAARGHQVKRIIHLSSAGVLGKVREEDVADEAYPPQPASIYEEAKLKGENAALRFAQEGMDVVVIRPGWVYGPRDRRTFKLIKTISSRKFIWPAKGKARQTPVYIDDLIKGILLSVEKAKTGEVYHLAGEEILTAREIIEAIAAACGKTAPRLSLPYLPARLAALLLEKTYRPFKREPPLNRAKLSFFTHSKPLSIQKAKTDLNFSPEIHFEQGIRRAVTWYKEKGWL